MAEVSTLFQKSFKKEMRPELDEVSSSCLPHSQEEWRGRVEGIVCMKALGQGAASGSEAPARWKR